LPFQISQQDVPGLSEEEAGFSRPAASDQHLVFTITLRSHGLWFL
jgi:hypothetical protein